MPAASPSSGSCNYPQTKVDQTPQYDRKGARYRNRTKPRVKRLKKVRYI